MAKAIYLFFIFLFYYNQIIAQSKLINGQEIDSIVINGVRLNDIDYRIKLVLEDHIKQIPLIDRLIKKNDLISVEVDAFTMNRLSIMEIDSLYKYNSFETQNFTFPYLVKIDLIKRKEKSLINLINYSKYFLYQYKGFDIILITNLNIQFPWTSDSVVVNYFWNKNDQIDNQQNYSIYTIDNNEVIRREYIRLYSNPGIPLSRKLFKEFSRQKEFIKTDSYNKKMNEIFQI